jgi:hypothetical protein
LFSYFFLILHSSFAYCEFIWWVGKYS